MNKVESTSQQAYDEPIKWHPKLSPEEIEEAVERACRGNCLATMMEFDDDLQSLEKLPYEAQKRIFLNHAVRDPYETLNAPCLYLFLDKPFAMDVLKQAALELPEHAVERVTTHGDHPKFQALHRFLLKEFGKEQVGTEMQAVSFFSLISRIKVYGLFGGFFHRMKRKETEQN